MVTLPETSIDPVNTVPALGALGLSLRNWWVMRRGALIQINPIYNFGMFARKSSSGNELKVFAFPVMFTNEGVKSGMVTNIDFNIQHNGKRIPLEIERKIEINPMTETYLRSAMSINDFRSDAFTTRNPFYPIEVPSKESTTAMVECRDITGIIPFDTEVDFEIKISYGINASSEIKFPFYIKHEDWVTAAEQYNFRWLKPSS